LAGTGDDTPPELQPIFSLLNSHANKLYHEGYFLKLNDLDTRMCSADELCSGKDGADLV
jgi:CCR4-NOT transcriptional complex subunit CAF120